MVKQVIAAAVAKGGDARVARQVLVNGRRVALWIRQSDGRQLVDHLGSRLEQFDQTRYLTPYELTRPHPQVTVFDAEAETARRASGLTRDDLGPEAAAARAEREAAGDDAGEVVERGSFRRLALALDTGAYGVLSVVSLNRGARNDADGGLLLEVLQRHHILVLEGGVVLDARAQADRNAIRFKLLAAAMEGDALIASTQQTRLQKARDGAMREPLPSGLVYASPDDPEYVRRLEAAGLGAAITRGALAEHAHVVTRDGVRTFVLPFPDRDVWRSIVLRVRWLRTLGDVKEVRRCIRRGYGPLADAPVENTPAADTPYLRARGGPPSTLKFIGIDEAEFDEAETATLARGPSGRPADSASNAAQEDAPPGAAAAVIEDPWADDRWPVGREKFIPVIRHNVWRHHTPVRWVRATLTNLRYWFASPGLYGEYAYTAHGLRAGAVDPDAPAPGERRPGVFPAPAKADDRASFANALARRNVASDGEPAGAATYAGAHAHALAHAYCAHPHAGRAGNVRRSGPRAGAPANRSPRAPQGFEACGIHLNAWYGPAGLRCYSGTNCSADRDHASSVTVVVEDVVLAAVLDAIDPETVRAAVGAWQVAAAFPDSVLEALRDEVARVRAEHDGAMRFGAALFASGNAAGGRTAVIRVNALQAALTSLEARLAAAERAADVDAEVVGHDWERIRRLAAALPTLVDAARAADRALDARLHAAQASDDDAEYHALAAHEGQLRALLDALGVSVDVHVDHTDAHRLAPHDIRRSSGRATPTASTDHGTAAAPVDVGTGHAVSGVDSAADDAVDSALAEATTGGVRPEDGAVRIVVRFASGACRTRYADVAYHPALQPERVWAYARLAAATPATCKAVAAVVAAELSVGGQRIARRKVRRVRAWTPAQARAAAIQYAAREFGRPVVDARGDAPDGALSDTTGDKEPDGHVRAVGMPNDGADTEAVPTGVPWPEPTLRWRTVAALSAEMDVPAAAVVHALLGNLLGPATWVAADRTLALDGLSVGPPSEPLPTAAPMSMRVWDGAAARGAEVGADCIGGCQGACGPRCPARRVAVRPSESQLHAAFPAYAARCVAAREGSPWHADDTVPLMDLAAELGVSKSMARYGAEHGGGLAHDASGRLFTRRSAFATGPGASLDRALAVRPDLATLDRAHWRLQADALRSLPGVKWVTLCAHASRITVLGPGGRKTRVWVHLPPDLAARLRRTALSEVVADWNRAHRSSHDLSAATAATAAPEAINAQQLAGPLTADLCLTRTVVLASLQRRGIGVAYDTYVRAVTRGAVLEITAVPFGGGPSCAHAVVPRAVQTTADRGVVRAWLDGAYADPRTWV